MRRKIPSTGALITFEAAARYQSFSRAAEELSLTEGAISRQIGVLEEYLGLQLFHRVKKRVSLSDIG
jgi:DNA-binding transcriptional LysR family regulator